MRYPAFLTLLIAAASVPLALLSTRVALSEPAREAAPPGFLTRLPPPLNTAPWREVGRLHRARGMDWDPVPGGEISPDGSYALQARGLTGDPRRNEQPLVVSLATGTTRVVTLDGDALYRVRTVCWDPLHPQFIYAAGIRHTKGSDPDLDAGEGERGLWRVQIDGTQVGRIGKPGEDVGLASDPMPDGTLLLYIAGEADKVGTYVSQRGIDTSTRHPAEPPPRGLKHPSPSGAVLWGQAVFEWALARAGEAGQAVSPEFAKRSLSVYEVATSRRAVVFTVDQVTMSFPKGTLVQFPSPYWLPDSSGLLLSLPFIPAGEVGGGERWQLWRLDLSGEAEHLLDGVPVTGWSANGRHWIFEENRKYYLVSVPQAASARPAR